MLTQNANERKYNRLAELGAGEAEPRWHVLWAHSNCERMIYEQLAKKGYDVLLPTVHRLSRNARAQRLYRVPLFPGYLFIRHAIDRFSYLDISQVRGLVKILGERWDRLTALPEREIEAIRRVQESDLPRMPHAYLREGETVRITDGPLANLEGIFIRSDAARGLLILSVQLLARSIAVKVDCSQVVPV